MGARFPPVTARVADWRWRYIFPQGILRVRRRFFALPILTIPSATIRLIRGLWSIEYVGTGLYWSEWRHGEPSLAAATRLRRHSLVPDSAIQHPLVDLLVDLLLYLRILLLLFLAQNRFDSLVGVAQNTFHLVHLHARSRRGVGPESLHPLLPVRNDRCDLALLGVR